MLYNNIAGFGLSENGIVFSTRKATRELMEEVGFRYLQKWVVSCWLPIVEPKEGQPQKGPQVATSFTYPSSVLLDKLGHFVDLEQCFQESGTIVAVVMVLLGTRRHCRWRC